MSQPLRSSQRRRIAVLALAIPAVTAAPALAVPADLRSGAPTSSLAGTHGSPDNEAALALERYLSSYAAPDRSAVAGPAPATVAAGGFDWGDAALGGGVTLVLALASAGGAVAFRRHGMAAAH